MLSVKEHYFETLLSAVDFLTLTITLILLKKLICLSNVVLFSFVCKSTAFTFRSFYFLQFINHF